MQFRRGFKTEANELARLVRSDLTLPANAPLDPFALAADLGIPIFGCHQFQITEAIILANQFSAVTVFDGSRCFIVHNDAHAHVRQNSNVAHELAHVLLRHTPMPGFDESGARYFSREMENEAEWLGPALLVSEEAALGIARRKLTLDTASAEYAVSRDLMQFRLNVVGAYRRVARVNGTRLIGHR